MANEYELYLVGGSAYDAWMHCITPFDEVEAARDYAAERDLKVFAIQVTGPTSHTELEEI